MSANNISSAAPDVPLETDIPDSIRQPMEAPSAGKKKLVVAVIGAFVLFLVLVFLVVQFAKDKLHTFSDERAASQAEKKAKSAGSASSRQAIDFSNLNATPKNAEKAAPSTEATAVPLANKGQNQTAPATAVRPPARPSMMSDISDINTAQSSQPNANFPKPPEPPKPPITPQELVALLNQSRSPAPSVLSAPGAGSALPRAKSIQEVAARTRNAGLTSTKQVSAVNLGDRRYVITRGHHIPCVLETEILTNLPGSVGCIVTENIYGTDGKVLLMEKGTRAVGEYLTGLKTGDVRLAVIWARIETPTGVVIDLDAQSADMVGASGVPGFVDNHWPQRIGAAILLSFIKDAVNYATTRATPPGTSGATTVTPSSTTNTGQDLSSKILDSTINIPATLIKHRGDLITMEVRHDLWFNDVYAVQ